MVPVGKGSPIFAKTHDFVCWLLGHTIQFPKSQRFVMARRVEETALSFQECLIRAARTDDRMKAREMREADILFEIGRLLGGWMRKHSGSDRRGPAVGAGPQ